MLLYWKQKRDNFIRVAQQDLANGVINSLDFLARMTSEYDGFCKQLDACSVGPIDPQPVESFKCQFCEDRTAVVILECRCQQLCVPCFTGYAEAYKTNGRQREFEESGEPIVNAENLVKCPHCTLLASFYLIARRWNLKQFFRTLISFNHITLVSEQKLISFKTC